MRKLTEDALDAQLDELERQLRESGSPAQKPVFDDKSLVQGWLWLSRSFKVNLNVPQSFADMADQLEQCRTVWPDAYVYNVLLYVDQYHPSTPKTYGGQRPEPETLSSFISWLRVNGKSKERARHWLVSSSKKGYEPVYLGLRTSELCQAIAKLNMPGKCVVVQDDRDAIFRIYTNNVIPGRTSKKPRTTGTPCLRSFGRACYNLVSDPIAEPGEQSQQIAVTFDDALLNQEMRALLQRWADVTARPIRQRFDKGVYGTIRVKACGPHFRVDLVSDEWLPNDNT